MNGIHDLGGMDGFTLPERDPKEPLFKHEWEQRVFGTFLSLWPSSDTPWPGDEVRFTMESMPPDEYLATPYYARWLYALEKLLVKYKLATERELRNPDGSMARVKGSQPVTPEEMLRYLSSEASGRVDQDIPPTFSGHTRAPRYVRGRRGTIHLDHGVFPFPDTRALGLGPKPQHCYSVMFSASELWGTRANPRDRVYVDLWDDYLEAIG
jgi:nitrile hydratase